VGEKDVAEDVPRVVVLVDSMIRAHDKISSSLLATLFLEGSPPRGETWAKGINYFLKKKINAQASWTDV
jgi:hypothetical protein